MSKDHPIRSALHLVHRVAQCVEKAFQAELGDNGLTPRQLTVLVTIAANEGLNQTQIVECTSIDRSTVADIVRRLHSKGWVRRQRTKDDAPAYTVKLTDNGRRIVRTAEPMSKRVDRRILSTLAANQREPLIGALSLIVEKFG